MTYGMTTECWSSFWRLRLEPLVFLLARPDLHTRGWVCETYFRVDSKLSKSRNYILNLLFNIHYHRVIYLTSGIITGRQLCFLVMSTVPVVKSVLCSPSSRLHYVWAEIMICGLKLWCVVLNGCTKYALSLVTVWQTQTNFFSCMINHLEGDKRKDADENMGWFECELVLFCLEASWKFEYMWFSTD